MNSKDEIINYIINLPEIIRLKELENYFDKNQKINIKLIELNDAERESIKLYTQGEALFVCGARRMHINVVLTQDELDSFGSGGGL